jgi:uncharacterized protein (UPF0147 family)
MMTTPQDVLHAREKALQHLADICTDEALPNDVRRKAGAMIARFFLPEPEEHDADAC